MAKYAFEMNRTSSTTLAVGSLACDATTVRRAKIFDLMFGSEATPADNALQWQVQRSTTQPTATSLTPTALDPADAAAIDDATENSTADGTKTANAILLSIPLNQRASYRWVAAPGGELVIPATANNGVHFTTPIQTAAIAVTATCHFEEQ